MDEEQIWRQLDDELDQALDAAWPRRKRMDQMLTEFWTIATAAKTKEPIKQFMQAMTNAVANKNKVLTEKMETGVTNCLMVAQKRYAGYMVMQDVVRAMREKSRDVSATEMATEILERGRGGKSPGEIYAMQMRRKSEQQKPKKVKRILTGLTRRLAFDEEDP